MTRETGRLDKHRGQVRSRPDPARYVDACGRAARC